MQQLTLNTKLSHPPSNMSQEMMMRDAHSKSGYLRSALHGAPISCSCCAELQGECRWKRSAQ